jgi:structural maintenance of chromosome 1
MDFITLDSAAVKPLPERLRSLGGSARPAIDLLEYDPALERAMVHACG